MCINLNILFFFFPLNCLGEVQFSSIYSVHINMHFRLIDVSAVYERYICM